MRPKLCIFHPRGVPGGSAIARLPLRAGGVPANGDLGAAVVFNDEGRADPRDLIHANEDELARQVLVQEAMFCSLVLLAVLVRTIFLLVFLRPLLFIIFAGRLLWTRGS